MMKNTLTDLNNYLFEQLERINDDSLTEEALDRELKKADAVVGISAQIISAGQLAFKTMQHLDQFGHNASEARTVPPMLQSPDRTDTE